MLQLREKPKEIHIPELPDDEKEVHEALAFRKGAIALDVVFDSKGRPFVVEVQGQSSGVSGITKDLASDGRVPTRVKEAAQKFKNGGFDPNPLWFSEISNNKAVQLDFIPEKYRPKSVVNGRFDSLFHCDSGKVIIKPLDYAQGRGIKIFDKTQKSEARDHADMLRERRGGFIAQSFIESPGAALAPNSLRGFPASLRLIVPFEVIGGGQVKILEPEIGYQRVAPCGMPADSDIDEYRKAGVVNYCRGAHAVPMSKGEYQRTVPAARAIVKELFNGGSKTNAYKREFSRELGRKPGELWSKLVNNHPAIHIIRARMYGFSNLGEVRDSIRFFRFIERELSLIDHETQIQIRGKSVYPSFVHISGSKGVMELSRIVAFLGYDKKFEFDTSSKGGELARVLRIVAKGKKPK